ncbi:short-chain dehydrogenase/reductase SDR [Desulfarculus baarsii DSM 2075]|uniref:Short-chain dehydrogenase/reductase SDR n=1 Tax=Desulfarculus baarsii (strain ATCC 33931 / DSM 2075 / LMG 7858 / VKM B-1802 / 2st14) TaxID=644282 RepID=E1QL70_DESB2|nr:SDR family oxidoreductase [Desulfarculus baarsii]ADK85335.1 short-chain dehydrogenase/reductase SDR [Desulfarculus baarsii DSM 2075]
MLKGKKVLIIGGGSGIGLAVAKLAQANGAELVVASRGASAQTRRLSEAVGAAVRTHDFDITAPDDHGRLFQEIGEIDHLVIAVRPAVRPAPLLAMDLAEVRRVFETKFWGPCGLIRVAHGFIRKAGTITLTSGVAGAKIYPGASAMALVNSLTETLCRVLAVELAPVRVNAVSPGFVKPKPAEMAHMAEKLPLGRFADAGEVAAAFLALITNPYQTGTVAVVDGGALLT